jgi:hypothetical protein
MQRFRRCGPDYDCPLKPSSTNTVYTICALSTLMETVEGFTVTWYFESKAIFERKKEKRTKLVV